MPTSSRDIEKQAAEWVAKHDLGNMTQEDAAAFDAWLAADRRALGAYCRIEGTLLRLERAGSAVGAGEDTVVVTDDAGPPAVAACPPRVSRRVVLGGSIAAGLASLCAIGAGTWLYRQENTVYSSGHGMVREVLLSDGSVVTLNTDSEISVRYTETLREIHLLRGEALFDVAKNKKRPFIVIAENTQVKAVGTSFSVSMLPQHPVQILVKEGVVELKRPSNEHDTAVRVKANTRVLVPDDSRYIAVNVAPTTVARDLAWQRGLLLFDNKTLREAATEYARYSDVHIVVDDASALRTITGSFAANDPVGFAKLTAKALDLQLEVNDREVRLFDRSEKKM